MIRLLFRLRSSLRRGLLCFIWRDVTDGAVQVRLVIPVDPFQGFPFDLTDGLPGSEELDDLGLEQTNDAFRVLWHHAGASWGGGSFYGGNK